MAESEGWTTYRSPLGPLTVLGGPRGVRNIHFPGEAPPLLPAAERAMPAVAEQLDGYFAGERRAFELDLDLRGSRLQKLIWAQLLEIPYGETTSYGEIARRVDAGAFPAELEEYMRARAVGTEVGRNPVPVVVACHRVVGSDGSLTGYRGGLARKRTLLALEGLDLRRDRVRRPQPESAQLGLL
jgi:methylated-DNA-[protein]-cysteine S-methyltransferase